MWWLIGAMFYLLMGVITFYPYGWMLWKVDSDQKEEFLDFLYDKSTPTAYLGYLAGWPFFLFGMTLDYIKFRFHQRSNK